MIIASKPSSFAAILVAGVFSGTTAAGGKSGSQVYTEVCAACHGGGVADAPQYRDRVAWEPLITEGQEVVTAHGWVGVRGMPARGGQTDLALEEFARGVVYMARAAGADWQAPDAAMLERIKEEEEKRIEELAHKP